MGGSVCRKNIWEREKLHELPCHSGQAGALLGEEAVERLTVSCAALPKFQIYYLTGDTGEQYNLYERFPEVAERLREKMIRYIEDGRSTPGAKQQNYAGQNCWEEIDWWVNNKEVRIDLKL